MPSSTSALHAVAGDTVELTDTEARSSVAIVPARGAIVTRFRVGDRDLLYLDEATLRDPAKNVRGGIPVLFPSPGRLTGDRFVRGGRSGAMKQHGFARDLAWETRSVAATDAARATLVLRATEATRAAYPYDFLVAITFSLARTTLRLDVDVENSGREPLPFAFGLHPYFLVPDAGKAAARIATHATRAFDNVEKRTVPFHGFDLTAKEVDLHLIDHGSTASELTWADGARLAIRGSAEMTRWVVWTLAGRDFVCVEPWTAPADALNTGESLIEVAPGGKRELHVELEYLAPPAAGA
jgi:galactose mutarotase-like enzyme